jgi:hypothetical protein
MSDRPMGCCVRPSLTAAAVWTFRVSLLAAALVRPTLPSTAYIALFLLSVWTAPLVTSPLRLFGFRTGWQAPLVVIAWAVSLAMTVAHCVQRFLGDIPLPDTISHDPELAGWLRSLGLDGGVPGESALRAAQLVVPDVWLLVATTAGMLLRFCSPCLDRSTRCCCNDHCTRNTVFDPRHALEASPLSPARPLPETPAGVETMSSKQLTTLSDSYESHNEGMVLGSARSITAFLSLIVLVVVAAAAPTLLGAPVLFLFFFRLLRWSLSSVRAHSASPSRERLMSGEHLPPVLLSWIRPAMLQSRWVASTVGVYSGLVVIAWHATTAILTGFHPTGDSVQWVLDLEQGTAMVGMVRLPALGGSLGFTIQFIAFILTTVLMAATVQRKVIGTKAARPHFVESLPSVAPTVSSVQVDPQVGAFGPQVRAPRWGALPRPVGQRGRAGGQPGFRLPDSDTGVGSFPPGKGIQLSAVPPSTPPSSKVAVRASGASPATVVGVPVTVLLHSRSVPRAVLWCCGVNWVATLPEAGVPFHHRESGMRCGRGGNLSEDGLCDRVCGCHSLFSDSLGGRTGGFLSQLLTSINSALRGPLGMSMAALAVLAWAVSFPSVLTYVPAVWVWMEAACLSRKRDFGSSTAMVALVLVWHCATVAAFVVSCVYAAFAAPNPFVVASRNDDAPAPLASHEVFALYGPLARLLGIVPGAYAPLRVALSILVAAMVAVYHKSTISTLRRSRPSESARVASVVRSRYAWRSVLHSLEASVARAGRIGGPSSSKQRSSALAASAAEPVADGADPIAKWMVMEASTRAVCAAVALDSLLDRVNAPSNDSDLTLSLSAVAGVTAEAPLRLQPKSVTLRDTTEPSRTRLPCCMGCVVQTRWVSWSVLTWMRTQFHWLALLALYVLGLSHVDCIGAGYMLFFVAFFVNNNLRQRLWRALVVYSALAEATLLLWWILALENHSIASSVPLWVLGLLPPAQSPPPSMSDVPSLWATVSVPSNTIIFVLSALQLPEYLEKEHTGLERCRRRCCSSSPSSVPHVISRAGDFFRQGADIEEITRHFPTLSKVGEWASSFWLRHGVWVCFGCYASLPLLTPTAFGLVNLLLLMVVLGRHLIAIGGTNAAKTEDTIEDTTIADGRAAKLLESLGVVAPLRAMAALQGAFLTARYLYQFQGVHDWFNRLWSGLFGERFLSVGELGLVKYADDFGSTLGAGGLYLQLLDSVVLLLVTMMMLGAIAEARSRARLARRARRTKLRSAQIEPSRADVEEEEDSTNDGVRTIPLAKVAPFVNSSLWSYPSSEGGGAEPVVDLTRLVQLSTEQEGSALSAHVAAAHVSDLAVSELSRAGSKGMSGSLGTPSGKRVTIWLASARLTDAMDDRLNASGDCCGCGCGTDSERINARRKLMGHASLMLWKGGAPSTVGEGGSSTEQSAPSDVSLATCLYGCLWPRSNKLVHGRWELEELANTSQEARKAAVGGTPVPPSSSATSGAWQRDSTPTSEPTELPVLRTGQVIVAGQQLRVGEYGCVCCRSRCALVVCAPPGSLVSSPDAVISPPDPPSKSLVIELANQRARLERRADSERVPSPPVVAQGGHSINEAVSSALSEAASSTTQAADRSEYTSSGCCIIRWGSLRVHVETTVAADWVSSDEVQSPVSSAGPAKPAAAASRAKGPVLSERVKASERRLSVKAVTTVYRHGLRQASESHAGSPGGAPSSRIVIPGSACDVMGLVEGLIFYHGGKMTLIAGAVAALLEQSAIGFAMLLSVIVLMLLFSSREGYGGVSSRSFFSRLLSCNFSCCQNHEESENLYTPAPSGHAERRGTCWSSVCVSLRWVLCCCCMGGRRHPEGDFVGSSASDSEQSAEASPKDRSTVQRPSQTDSEAPSEVAGAVAGVGVAELDADRQALTLLEPGGGEQNSWLGESEPAQPSHRHHHHHHHHAAAEAPSVARGVAARIQSVFTAVANPILAATIGGRYSRFGGSSQSSLSTSDSSTRAAEAASAAAAATVPRPTSKPAKHQLASNLALFHSAHTSSGVLSNRAQRGGKPSRPRSESDSTLDSERLGVHSEETDAATDGRSFGSVSWSHVLVEGVYPVLADILPSAALSATELLRAGLVHASSRLSLEHIKVLREAHHELDARGHSRPRARQESTVWEDLRHIWTRKDSSPPDIDPASAEFVEREKEVPRRPFRDIWVWLYLLSWVFALAKYLFQFSFFSHSSNSFSAGPDARWIGLWLVNTTVNASLPDQYHVSTMGSATDGGVSPQGFVYSTMFAGMWALIGPQFLVIAMSALQRWAHSLDSRERARQRSRVLWLHNQGLLGPLAADSLISDQTLSMTTGDAKAIDLLGSLGVRVLLSAGLRRGPHAAGEAPSLVHPSASAVGAGLGLTAAAHVARVALASAGGYYGRVYPLVFTSDSFSRLDRAISHTVFSREARLRRSALPAVIAFGRGGAALQAALVAARLLAAGVPVRLAVFVAAVGVAARLGLPLPKCPPMSWQSPSQRDAVEVVLTLEGFSSALPSATDLVPTTVAPRFRAATFLTPAFESHPEPTSSPARISVTTEPQGPSQDDPHTVHRLLAAAASLRTLRARLLRPLVPLRAGIFKLLERYGATLCLGVASFLLVCAALCHLSLWSLPLLGLAVQAVLAAAPTDRTIAPASVRQAAAADHEPPDSVRAILHTAYLGSQSWSQVLWPTNLVLLAAMTLVQYLLVLNLPPVAWHGEAGHAWVDSVWPWTESPSVQSWFGITFHRTQSFYLLLPQLIALVFGIVARRFWQSQRRAARLLIASKALRNRVREEARPSTEGKALSAVVSNDASLGAAIKIKEMIVRSFRDQNLHRQLQVQRFRRAAVVGLGVAEAGGDLILPSKSSDHPGHEASDEGALASELAQAQRRQFGPSDLLADLEGETVTASMWDQSQHWIARWSGTILGAVILLAALLEARQDLQTACIGVCALWILLRPIKPPPGVYQKRPSACGCGKETPKGPPVQWTGTIAMSNQEVRWALGPWVSLLVLSSVFLFAQMVFQMPYIASPPDCAEGGFCATWEGVIGLRKLTLPGFTVPNANRCTAPGAPVNSTIPILEVPCPSPFATSGGLGILLVSFVLSLWQIVLLSSPAMKSVRMSIGNDATRAVTRGFLWMQHELHRRAMQAREWRSSMISLRRRLRALVRRVTRWRALLDGSKSASAMGVVSSNWPPGAPRRVTSKVLENGDVIVRWQPPFGYSTDVSIEEFAALERLDDDVDDVPFEPAGLSEEATPVGPVLSRARTGSIVSSVDQSHMQLPLAVMRPAMELQYDVAWQAQGSQLFASTVAVRTARGEHSVRLRGVPVGRHINVQVRAVNTAGMGAFSDSGGEIPTKEWKASIGSEAVNSAQYARKRAALAGSDGEEDAWRSAAQCLVDARHMSLDDILGREYEARDAVKTGGAVGWEPVLLRPDGDAPVAEPPAEPEVPPSSWCSCCAGDDPESEWRLGEWLMETISRQIDRTVFPRPIASFAGRLAEAEEALDWNTAKLWQLSPSTKARLRCCCWCCVPREWADSAPRGKAFRGVDDLWAIDSTAALDRRRRTFTTELVRDTGDITADPASEELSGGTPTQLNGRQLRRLVERRAFEASTAAAGAKGAVSAGEVWRVLPFWARLLLLLHLLSSILLSHTQALVVLVAILGMMFNPCLISTVPVMVLLLGILPRYPRAPSAAWAGLVVWCAAVLALRFVLQLPVFCLVWNARSQVLSWALFPACQDGTVISPDSSPTTISFANDPTQPIALLGLIKYGVDLGGPGFATGVTWDCLLLLALLIHRASLRTRGAWSADGNVFISAGHAQVRMGAKTVAEVMVETAEPESKEGAEDKESKEDKAASERAASGALQVVEEEEEEEGVGEDPQQADVIPTAQTTSIQREEDEEDLVFVRRLEMDGMRQRTGAGVVHEPQPAGSVPLPESGTAESQEDALAPGCCDRGVAEADEEQEEVEDRARRFLMTAQDSSLRVVRWASNALVRCELAEEADEYAKENPEEGKPLRGFSRTASDRSRWCLATMVLCTYDCVRGVGDREYTGLDGKSPDKPGHDLHLWGALVQMVLLLFTALSFAPMTGNGSGLQQELQFNQFSGGLVLALLIQIALLALDRLSYLYRSSAMKAVLHVTVAVFIHVFVFFIVPVSTQRQFGSENSQLVVFYIFWMIYLALGAAQLRNGFSRTPPRDSLKSNGFGWVNAIIFKVYAAIPFLLELRTLLDWAGTRTSLDVWMWVKLESIHNDLFRVQCDMQNRKEYREILSGKNPQPWYLKLLSGWLYVAAILIIIVAPMLVFSTLNPVLQDNLVTAVTANVRIIGSSRAYAIFSTSQVQSILLAPNIAVAPNQESWFVQLQKNATAAPSSSQQQEQMASPVDSDWLLQTQRVVTFPFPDNSWEISPPSIESLSNMLVSEYNQSKSDSAMTAVQLSLETVFTRPGPPTATNARYISQTALTVGQIKTIHRALLQAKNHTVSGGGTAVGPPVVVEGLFPYIYRLPATVSVAPVGGRRRDMQVQLHRGSTLSSNLTPDLWWTVQIPSNDKIGPAPLGGGLEFVTVSDRVAPDILVQSLGGYSIFAVYTLILITVGGLFRAIFVVPTERVLYTELEDCRYLLELCEAIHIAEADTSFPRHLENETYLFETLIGFYRSPDILSRITRKRDDDDVAH